MSTGERCPECEAPLAYEARPDASGYHCPTHGLFVVTATAEAMGFWQKPVEIQRAALQRTRETMPRGDLYPAVTFYHLSWAPSSTD